MLDIVLITLFVTGGFLIVYHHLLYPRLLKYLATARRQTGREANKRPAALLEAELPSMALLVPAYNEQQMIAQKVANIAALDYPDDRLAITFALDGCTDNTLKVLEKAIAEHWTDPSHVKIVAHAKNRGKIQLLNEHIGMAREQIIALNDVTAMIEPDALRRAAAYYKDEKMGVVCATYRLGEAGSEGERQYWQYQTKIKEDESAIASVIGPHGAFYFIRRDLWTPLASDTINDDFILPMRIVVAGYRAVYDRDIVAVEAERTTSTQEFSRRIRIGAGNMQQLLRLYDLGSPKLGWTAFLFWSGKGLRPLMSFIILLTFALTALLAARGWLTFQFLLAVELCLLALAAYIIRRDDMSWPKPLAWLAYLVRGHTASLFGAVRVVSGSGMRW